MRYADLSRALARRGHSVDIFCILSEVGSAREEVVGNIRIHRYPAALEYRTPAFKAVRRRPLPLLRYAHWCRSIPADKFDFILFNQWPLAHIVLAPRSIRAKAAIDWCEFRTGSLFLLLQAYLPRLVPRNVANSLPLKTRLEGISGRSFDFLPSGILPDIYRSKPRSERQGVLYLGRVTEHKNLPLLLSAFEAVAAKGYGGHLRIAGDGPALPAIREWTKSSKIADRVDILGAVDEPAKVDLLANSELLLLTSRREGFPRVVAEAMASGLPVVTADYPENGAKEVVLQYRIGQVAHPTAEALSDAMLRAMEGWNTYSEAGALGSKSLDWEVLVNEFLQIANSVQRPA